VLGNQLRAKTKGTPTPARRIEKVNRPSLESFSDDTSETPAVAPQNLSPIAAQESQDDF
jgi:hypothetical protein